MMFYESVVSEVKGNSIAHEMIMSTIMTFINSASTSYLRQSVFEGRGSLALVEPFPGNPNCHNPTISVTR